jgi:septum formation protein
MPLPLYLASRSPRRQEMLQQAGIRFQVHVPKEDELAAPKFRQKGKTSRQEKSAEVPSARKIVRKISLAKAEACARELQELGVKSALVLSADTLVFLDHHVLGKPTDPAGARKMLRKLSGRWHEVYTGVTALRLEHGRTKVHGIQIRTRVKFFALKPDWIDWYVATGEPLDKAGSYGCQGFGASLVERFSGSYTNVVGLPLGETLALLEKAGRLRRRELQEKGGKK